MPGAGRGSVVLPLAVRGLPSEICALIPSARNLGIASFIVACSEGSAFSFGHPRDRVRLIVRPRLLDLRQPEADVQPVLVVLDDVHVELSGLEGRAGLRKRLSGGA